MHRAQAICRLANFNNNINHHHNNITSNNKQQHATSKFFSINNCMYSKHHAAATTNRYGGLFRRDPHREWMRQPRDLREFFCLPCFTSKPIYLTHSTHKHTFWRTFLFKNQFFLRKKTHFSFCLMLHSRKYDRWGGVFRLRRVQFFFFNLENFGFLWQLHGCVEAEHNTHTHRKHPTHNNNDNLYEYIKLEWDWWK